MDQKRAVKLHPYREQPARAFWSRAVSSRFQNSEVAKGTAPYFVEGDRVVSAGSCFASNLVPWLEKAGLEYLRTERPHPVLAHMPENLGYLDFSAMYGNIYSSRQMLQLIQRSRGEFKPVEDRWHEQGRVVDPFRPGLKYPATSDREFDLLSAQHLEATKAAFDQATVIVLTLGLTETWVSALDGAAFPSCPGTIAGTFDPAKHVFLNLSASEVRSDIEELVGLVRITNPSVRFILTVSPVPLVATATAEHVLVASTYSKSVLRVAASEVAHSLDKVMYFPAYEIVTGPQSQGAFFEDDFRHVSSAGIEAVMTSLLENSQLVADFNSATNQDGRSTRLEEAPMSQRLSERISTAECEEMASEW